MKTPNEIAIEIIENLILYEAWRDNLYQSDFPLTKKLIEQALTNYAEEKVNEAIETCAFVCQEFGHDPYPVQKRIAEAIRQLKAKQK